MQCNIDAKGQAIRLMGGLATLGVAAVLAVLTLAGVLPQAWWWFVVIGAAIGGGFMVFEARSGWCVVRAMGFKTPF